MTRAVALTVFALHFLLLTLAVPAVAQSDASEEQRLAKFKAIFIYNFIEYVKWPESKREGPLIIGILGESDVAPYLHRIIAKRKDNKRPLVVEVHAPEDDLSACHVLFVPTAFDKELKKLHKELVAAHVMLVGEAEDAAKRGASISFKLVKGKLKFEINPKNLAAAELHMSSHLLRLGLIVD